MMHINKIGFMTSMSHLMHHCRCEHVANDDKESFHKVSDKMPQVCNKGGFTIERIECDRAFESVMNAVSDNVNIEMDYASAQAHVGAAERNVRTLKETIRTKFHRCGCNTLPKQMIIAIAEQSADQLNVFPAKHGISKCCSPNTIVTGQTLDYKRHCAFEFGEHAQAHHEPRKKSGMKERAVDAMHL